MEINPCSAEYRYFMANSRFFSGKTTEALGEYLISLDMIAYKGDKLSDCINSNHNFIVYKKKVWSMYDSILKSFKASQKFFSFEILRNYFDEFRNLCKYFIQYFYFFQ